MIERDIVTVTVTINPRLLARVDGRAESLDLNRSQYFRRLAREDLRLKVPESEEEAAQEPAAP